jgi:hypothetical protein
MASKQDWEIFTAYILLLSSTARVMIEDIDVFLLEGQYDFHRLRQLQEVKRRLAPYATIQDRNRQLQGSSQFAVTEEE